MKFPFALFKCVQYASQYHYHDRNLDPGEGLYNRTRIAVLNVKRKVLQYRIISKDKRFRGKVVLIPRIRLLPNVKLLPMPLKRLQFLVRLAFAMAINKSQG